MLDWADTSSYTVIEGGDSEELWYIRDFDDYDGPTAELDAIINKNQEVYNKLKSLQHRGRYIRIKGNHDSYLDHPEVRNRLNATMNQPGSSYPFDLYDFAIIPGVKTLQDSWHGGGLDSTVDLVKGDLPIEDFVTAALERVKAQSLGLDSTGYTDTKPMIVAHGHQWDFWNCRGNELVGKMLSNLVGVPADQLLDPFVDARGIAWGGDPVVNFADVAADLPVLNNWKATRPSVKFAHEIQHQSSADRLLVDDVFFMETVAALSASLGLEIDQPDDNGDHKGAADYPDVLERFMALRFNQLCLGHTHFPQSQPFWDIEGLLLPLGLGNLIREVTSTFLFGWEPTLNLVRSLYYNSGTAGWHEGVIWAIEITELGHARLVFWTHNSIEPETMDWELDEISPELRAQLDAQVDTIQDQVVSFLRMISADNALAATGSIASVPMELVAGIVAQSSSNVELDIGTILNDTTQAAESAISGLQSLIGELIMSSALREAGASQQRTFTLRVPVPAAIEDALGGVTELLGQISGIDPVLIPKLACGWLQVVRNLPFFGGFESRRNVSGIDDRVFWVIVSLLFQLPASEVTTSTLALTAQSQFDEGELVVTLTVG